ncbi:MAG: GtrA family protein [Armatimonadetes bacterium]|nr:GtrA family protein [Armatimonadota bacterium]
MLTKKPPRVIREMFKFGVVGAVSTVIDVALLKFSHHFMANAPDLLWLAVAIGYAGGTVNGYFWNSRWSFRYDTTGKEKRKLTQFAIVSAVGFTLTELIVLMLVHKHGFGKIIAKLIAIPIVFFWNFSANKLWTFRKTHK